uniref:VWFA domain-containing protein n=1 Tax=Ascaris lumbricoides TaxID=6252 RepID=A0A9J2PG51_ASCLU
MSEDTTVSTTSSPKTTKQYVKITNASTTATTASPSTTTNLPIVHCKISDILFVLDATGSVRHFYKQQKRYMADIARQLNIGSHAQHVGLIIYSSKSRQKVVVQMDDKPDKETFLKTIERLPFHAGITATGAALDLSLRALQKRRSDKRTAVLVLTDGFTFDDVEEQSKNLNVLPNVITLVAGVPDTFDRKVLNIIAGDPSRVLLGESEKTKVLDALRC